MSSSTFAMKMAATAAKSESLINIIDRKFLTFERALRRIVIYLLSCPSRVGLDPESGGSSEGIVPFVLLEYSGSTAAFG
ncbi:hypothetical protein V6N13_123537 [Hibiscus sabdariffa]|uniref:Uncharacterized protein n=1 Tax=Hibiscus sabdariffa TaxID=183260 RepID=A0ABR2QTP5_9ROSI